MMFLVDHTVLLSCDPTEGPGPERGSLVVQSFVDAWVQVARLETSVDLACANN